MLAFKATEILKYQKLVKNFKGWQMLMEVTGALFE